MTKQKYITYLHYDLLHTTIYWIHKNEALHTYVASAHFTKPSLALSNYTEASYHRENKKKKNSKNIILITFESRTILKNVAVAIIIIKIKFKTLI